jgi:hypothetical protein
MVRIRVRVRLSVRVKVRVRVMVKVNNINEWENALKTHKAKNNNFKKQIKKKHA